MVKAGERSNWNKAKGSDGSSASSNSGTASPSSPTRRLKKGGKRRKRPCYKESCTLCPSFGYEGSAALSCSRHKKEGMRNLTARRCQYAGCFTAANFGMPGDKPRFCLAHSTEGMVNRNKPRAGEGMMMTVSPSSRRTTKATNSVYDGNNTNNEESEMLKAEAWADAQASEGYAGVENSPVSAGDIIMYVGSAGKRFDINEGDHDGALSSRALRNVTSRGSGRSAVTSVEHGSPVSSMELTSKGDKSNGIMSHKRTSSSMSVWIPTPPWETVSAAFVSRGDGLDGPSAGGPEEKPPGGIIGVASGGNGRRVRSGNVEEYHHGPATVPREPYRHNKFNVAHLVETDEFEKHFLSNGTDGTGGVPDRRGGVDAPFSLNFTGDVGNSGDIMNGSGRSIFMDGLNSLEDSDEVDSDIGFEIGATLEEILGVGRDDDVTGDFDLDPSANASAMQFSVGVSLNSNRCINFEIGHLSGLNSVFLSGVHTKYSSQDTIPQQQQGQYLCSDASGIRVASDIGDMSSLTPSSSSSVDAAVRSISKPVTPTPTPATSQGTPSAPGTPVTPDALISPKHSVEQHVAMSEMVWEPTAEERELASACDVIRYNIDQDLDNLGEGDEVAPGESTGGGNRSMDVGEACVNPPQKRQRYSLSDNNQHTSIPTHLGSPPLGNRSIKHGDMDPVPSGNFPSPSGSQHSTAPSCPLLAGLGLTVATPLTHAGQVNSIAGETPGSASGVMGGSEQGDGGNMGLGNRRIPSGNSMGDVLLNGEDVCLGQPGYHIVGTSSSLPVHVVMGS